jgi:hypothetical protein
MGSLQTLVDSKQNVEGTYGMRLDGGNIAYCPGAVR